MIVRREFAEQPADVGDRPRGIEAAGQVDCLAAAGACLIEFALQGVPDGEQREVERLAANVAGVHIEGSQRIYISVCMPCPREWKQWAILAAK